MMEQKIGAVDLGLPKVLLRLCMRLLSGSSSLVISDSSPGVLQELLQWCYPVVALYWPCGNILCCHWFKYMMVMTRVTLVLTR